LKELQEHYENEEQVSDLATTLVNILKYNRLQTQTSLYHLNALPVLSMVIEYQQKTNCVGLEDEENIGLQARIKMLSVLEQFLSDDIQMSLYAVQDSRTISVLFSLLFQLDVRHFALKQIISLLAKTSMEESISLELYHKYMNLFQRVQKGPLPSHFSLLVTLFKGMRKVMTINKSSQDLFRESHSFIKIINLLANETNPQNLPLLCLQVLKTLNALMRANDQNKDYFYEKIGNNKLAMHINAGISAELQTSESLLHHHLITLLFEMLVDQRLDDNTKYNQYNIKNPKAVALIFSVFPNLPPEQQAQILSMFCDLVKRNTINKSLCCGQDLIFILLQIIHSFPQLPDNLLLRKGLQLIRILGTHSITVRELKLFFRFLKSDEKGFRPQTTALFLKTLQYMAKQRRVTSPKEYFNFDTNSGMWIGKDCTGIKWSDKGYSFTTWIRQETNQQPLIDPLYKLSTNSGDGVEVGIQGGVVTVSFVSSQKKTSISFQDFLLKEKIWYFLCITHNNSKVPWGICDVKLYIDGSLVQKAPLPYPQFNEEVRSCMIGCTTVNSLEGSKSILHGFCGQMGAIHFFNEPLSPLQIEILHSLPPDSNALHTNTLIGSKQGRAMGENIQGKIFLCYHCKSRKDGVILDNTPCDNKGKSDYRHAHILGSLHSCVTKDIADAIHCMGGLKVLLPLFAQLAQPMQTLGEGEERLIKRDSELSGMIMGLMGHLLHANLLHQQHLVLCQGFSAVSVALLSVPSSYINSHFLSALQKVMDAIEIEELEISLLQDLLLNFNIWTYASGEVQEEVLELIFKYLRQGHTIKNLFGVQEILDALRVFFWIKSTSVSMGIEPNFHPVTKECLGTRLDDISELKQLRKQLLKILTFSISQRFTENDIRCIVCYLLDSHVGEHIVDVLETFVGMIEKDRGFRLEVLGMGGADILLYILPKNYEACGEHIRILCLQGITLLMQAVGEMEAKMKNKFKAEQVFMILYDVLSPHSLTINLYSALSKIMLGLLPNEDKELDDSSKFSVLEVIVVILKLLCLADDSLVQHSLQQFAIILSVNPANISAFLTIPNWPYLLLQLYHPDKGKARKMFIITIIRTLAVYGLVNQKMGWKVISQVSSFLLHLSLKVPEVKYDIVMKDIFLEIFQALKCGLLTPLSEIAMENCIHMFGLLENFIFYKFKLEDDEGGGVPVTNVGVRSGTMLTLLLQSHSNSSDAFLFLPLLETAVDFALTYKLPFVRSLDKLYKNPHPIFIVAKMSLLYMLTEYDVQGIEWISEITRNDPASSQPSSLIFYLLSFLLALLRKTIREEQKVDAKLVQFTQQLMKICKPKLANLEKKHENVGAVIEEFCSDDPDLASLFHENNLKIWDPISTAIFAETPQKKDLVSYIGKRESRLNKETHNMLVGARQLEVENVKRMQMILQTIHDKMNAPELARCLLLNSQYTESYHKATDNWRHILRSLTHERGPWGMVEDKVYYKLDKTENSKRQRKKLKRAYNYQKHMETRQGGGKEEEGKKEEREMEELDPLAHSGIKLTDFIKKVDQELETEDWEFEIETEEDKKGYNNLEEKVIYKVGCSLITPLQVTHGTLELSTRCLYFYCGPNEGRKVTKPPARKPKDRKWALDQITEIHLRRFRLQRSALEIFLLNKTNYFFNFEKKERYKVYKHILGLKPPNLVYCERGSPQEIFRRSAITKKWQQRKISNFEYLMHINTIAGRTYNDLSQYPIFPWVLRDYTSSTIDLDDESVYRDLSKPMGAQNEDRLKSYLERYKAFDDPNIPPFHYGTHYSSSGVVLYYLIRLEPFTTFHIQLQEGKFDHADRLFSSIPLTWQNCLHSLADVKELTPEWFYMPEFLMNINEHNLGQRQNGVFVDEVELPPWAPTPHDFIRINKMALESDYVSAHLHQWIDLIFGFKQRGIESVKAHNVFYYLTYEGMVDLNSIQDESLRRATESQIDNFGQTPTQLLNKPHPKRSPPTPHSPFLFSPVHKKLRAYFVNVTQNIPLLFVAVPSSILPSYLYLGLSTDHIITVDRNRVAASHSWLENVAFNQLPFTLELDPLLPLQRQIGTSFAEEVGGGCFAVSNDGKILISCGYWDNSFKCNDIESSEQLQSISKHKDIVTCLAIGEHGQILVTGSKDTTIMVWQIISKNQTHRINEVPKLTLYGHNDSVMCVSLSVELDILASGSKDGSVIIHSLSSGQYVYSIYPYQQLGAYPTIKLVQISQEGHIIVYSPYKNENKIFVYSINGDEITRGSTAEKINVMVTSSDSTQLVTGSRDVVIHSLHQLEVLYKINTNSEVRCMSMTGGEQYLVVGLEDGKLIIIGCL